MTLSNDGGLSQAVSIVVPTYREADNLTRLAERIQAALEETGISWELLIVDDDSGDGIDEVVTKLSRTLPVRLEIRRERPRDLSVSVLQGIQSASHDLIVVMDADLSHPPERIVDLLANLDGDHDIVIGSRYLPESAIDGEWGAGRLLNSRVATALTYPLVTCSDPMAGFFAVNRASLPRADALRPVGFKIALELIVRGRLRVKEIPIKFQDRKVGRSKMNLSQQVKFLRHLGRLYRFRLGVLVRCMSFCLASLTGSVFDFIGYAGLQS